MNSIITPQTEANKEARALIKSEVSGRYQKERMSAPRWRRLVIWMKIQKEVADEMRRKFPPHALYALRRNLL